MGAMGILMSEGYIKLFRRINDWEWKTEPLTLSLFIHLVTNANHKNNNWRGIKIKRGQILTGRKQLSLQTGLTERQVRTALKNLETTGEVTSKTTNKYSIISITNYEMYQASDQQTTSKRPASDQQTTTNKNDNNDKNEKNRGVSSETPPKPKNKKGTRLDDSWELPTEWGEWAESEGLSYEEICKQEEVFKDYWIAKPGKEGVKLNWKATWRNWIRRHREFKK